MEKKQYLTMAGDRIALRTRDQEVPLAVALLFWMEKKKMEGVLNGVLRASNWGADKEIRKWKTMEELRGKFIVMVKSEE